MKRESIDPERFAQALSARTAIDHDPVSSLCLACTDLIGVSGAGLMLGSRGRSLTSVGVSDRMSEAVEQIEYTLGQGPCVAAYRRKVPVFDADLTDNRIVQWDEFRQAAVAAGARAVFGFPLLVDRVCIGALNLYHDRSGELSDRQIDDAVVVAGLAGRMLMSWQADAAPGTVAWQLERVPDHRMEIHQATGMISVQADISIADALVLLRAYSYSENRPVSSVAAGVVSGELHFD